MDAVGKPGDQRGLSVAPLREFFRSQRRVSDGAQGTQPSLCAAEAGAGDTDPQGGAARALGDGSHPHSSAPDPASWYGAVPTRWARVPVRRHGIRGTDSGDAAEPARAASEHVAQSTAAN